MIETISVDLNKLYANKLKLEDYFILYCLVNKDEELLVKYTTQCGGIDTNVFQKLRNSGFIILSDEVNITFNSIRITEQTKTLFNVIEEDSFESLFTELRSVYPKSVKRLTGGVRPLHNDLPRCKKIYKQTLKDCNFTLNIDLHRKILLCVQKYHRDHLKDNKQEFMQLLVSFLHQRTWEQYIDEIIENKPVIKQSDDI